jgi:hypothetical protein
MEFASVYARARESRLPAIGAILGRATRCCVVAGQVARSDPYHRRVDSLEPQPSDELAELMDTWSSLVQEVVHVAAAVGRANASGPRLGSPFASEIDELRSHSTMPEGALELVARDTLGYLSAAGRHCLAVSKLLATREVFVSLMPLLRAQLETYGRIAWFLEPAGAEGNRTLPHRRIARHHMDALASLCRRRYSASRRRDPGGAVKELKLDRDTVRNQTLELFPDAQLAWSQPGDEDAWICGDDQYLGLGAGASLFDRIVLAQARGHYDSLSDFTHPSIITVRQMTRANERDGHISYDWHVEPDDIARQVWNCGAMHAQTTKLIASWLGLLVVDEVDDLLDKLALATGTSR